MTTLTLKNVVMGTIMSVVYTDFLQPVIALYAKDLDVVAPETFAVVTARPAEERGGEGGKGSGSGGGGAIRGKNINIRIYSGIYYAYNLVGLQQRSLVPHAVCTVPVR